MQDYIVMLKQSQGKGRLQSSSLMLLKDIMQRMRHRLLPLAGSKSFSSENKIMQNRAQHEKFVRPYSCISLHWGSNERTLRLSVSPASREVYLRVLEATGGHSVSRWWLKNIARRGFSPGFEWNCWGLWVRNCHFGARARAKSVETLQ